LRTVPCSQTTGDDPGLNRIGGNSLARSIPEQTTIEANPIPIRAIILRCRTEGKPNTKGRVLNNPNRVKIKIVRNPLTFAVYEGKGTLIGPRKRCLLNRFLLPNSRFQTGRTGGAETGPAHNSIHRGVVGVEFPCSFLLSCSQVV